MSTLGAPSDPSAAVAVAALPQQQPPPICVCVVGVGYVGLTLVRQFGRRFRTVGFDVSEARIAQLRQEPEFASSQNPNVLLTTDPDAMAQATHFFIAVPTNLNKDNTVNLGHVVAALGTVCGRARRGSCIVIESSVPVGTTRKLLGPYQHDYLCGMSPERIDPGRVVPAPSEIPKLVSALTPRALKAVVAIYEAVFADVRAVSRPEVAEMTKLYENCYRMVNIAYVNEISDACRAHAIDAHEVIAAAASKPFGFQPFYPGLGVGGHCIPVNPFYLFANNARLPILAHATALMLNRPRRLARRFHRRCLKAMQKRRDFWLGAMPRIVVVGLGFKAGQADVSGSPALAFLQTLHELGCLRLAFYDPLVADRPFEWVEKLGELFWTGSYVDNKFDGLYICGRQEQFDLAFTKNLTRTVVGSYVEL